MITFTLGGVVRIGADVELYLDPAFGLGTAILFLGSYILYSVSYILYMVAHRPSYTARSEISWIERTSCENKDQLNSTPTKQPNTMSM